MYNIATNRVKIEPGVKGILLLLLFGQLLFINGIYLFSCILVFYGILYYLQHPYKSSVFTIMYLYHLLQVYAGVLMYTYAGQDMNRAQEHMGVVTLASLIGLIIMFIPLIYYQHRFPPVTLEILKKHVNRFSINRSFNAYVTAFMIASFLTAIKFIYGGYTQIIVSLINVKWFFFLLFGFQAILKNKRKKEFYFFITLEFVLGFASFFSEFKTVLFFTTLLYLTLLLNITMKKLSIAAGIGFLGMIMVLIWTNVKTEYRNFLNKGRGIQNVSVSRNEALVKLYELSNKNNESIFTSATGQFLYRLQATKNFALTMKRVPNIIPYQNGKNWTETFQFVLTPRILNPNKPVIDFSTKVTKYTGIQHAGMQQGTSFSLGYFADCYIDFGIMGMMIPIFLIGLFFAFFHNYFLRNSSNNLIFNYSVTGALFMEFFALEMDNTYLLGRLFAGILTFLMLKLIFFKRLVNYLTEDRNGGK